MGQPGKYNEREIEYQFLFQHLQTSKGYKLLDVGPGDSGLDLPLIQCGYEVEAIDIKPLHKWVTKGDIKNVRYPDNTFDVVLCISTLEHIPEPAKAVQQMLRVAKSGGLLIFSFPYNLKTHIANVYRADYLVAVFNDEDLDRWLKDRVIIKDKIYWKQWSGKHWRDGKKNKRASRVSINEAQGISLALTKV